MTPPVCGSLAPHPPHATPGRGPGAKGGWRPCPGREQLVVRRPGPLPPVAAAELAAYVELYGPPLPIGAFPEAD